MKKTLKEQLDRSQELIKYDLGGDTKEMAAASSNWTCSFQKCSNPGSVMVNSTHCCIPDPNGQHSSLADCQSNCSNFEAGWFCFPPGGGGQGSCIYTQSMNTGGPNGPFATEQDCETAAYCAGSTSVDCTQYGVDYDPVTLDNSAGGFFSPQGLTLATNGNCQGIQNKIQQVNNIPNQDKKDCRLDYLNLLLTLCQGNSGNVQVSQTFINTMTNRYNNKGCYGIGGSVTNIQNNSICDKKADFCPGNTPMKQAKCQWLTDFINNQTNCGC
tara:strand:+ start:3894 stop:4703 length:810 start_codon:yes stop_codon:yes gene_type:complete